MGRFGKGEYLGEVGGGGEHDQNTLYRISRNQAKTLSIYEWKYTTSVFLSGSFNLT